MYRLNDRFEEPNQNNRWDSPLFTVQPDDELDLEAVYKVLFEKKPPPPNMSTQNVCIKIILKAILLSHKNIEKTICRLIH